MSGALYDDEEIFPEDFDPMTAGMFLIAPGGDLSEAKLSRTNQLESHDPNSDIALAGEISWCQKIEPDHGIRFF